MVYNFFMLRAMIVTSTDNKQFGKNFFQRMGSYQAHLLRELDTS